MSSRLLHVCTLLGLLTLGTAADAQQRHNIVLFVADGLRAGSVSEQAAPTLQALAREGVWLRNSHSVIPSLTTPNAAAMATGHYTGDTGDFANSLYAGFAAAGEPRSLVADLEQDQTIVDLDARFGNYVNESTILQLARRAGYGTAVVGKQGPTLIFDSPRGAPEALMLDDASGAANGPAFAEPLAQRMRALGLPLRTPGRGANGIAGTRSANLQQQDYMISVTTRALLPLLVEQKKPFVLVFWSRDPDGSQHEQGDSAGTLVPGINGSTSLAAVRNADDDLARIRAALFELGVATQTDLIVTADHGFSTISKESATSAAARKSYDDTAAGSLPAGFLALDLATELKLPVYDADDDSQPLPTGRHPKKGNALLGRDRLHPQIVVAANSGVDLLYLHRPDDRRLAQRIVAVLLRQDYVSGLFVDRRLGAIPGALTLDDLGLEGSAVMPRPSILVNFRSFDSGCGEPERCGVIVADTRRRQGQGAHGSLSRADTHNFMALAGPDFRRGFVDEAPVSNADLGRTIVSLIGAPFVDRGALVGRVLTEAMPGGALPPVRRERRASRAAGNGLQTLLDLQWVGDTRYIDAGGFAGRTLGLPASAP